MITVKLWWYALLLSLLVWIRLIYPPYDSSGAYRIPQYIGTLSKDFNPPIHRDISLSATFGELRPNHFMPADIKSAQEDQGETRVRHCPWIYIPHQDICLWLWSCLVYQHPNGHMSVYGHLDRFILLLENYILKETLLKEKIWVGSIPGTCLPSQGQLICYKGNTRVIYRTTPAFWNS